MLYQSRELQQGDGIVEDRWAKDWFQVGGEELLASVTLSAELSREYLGGREGKELVYAIACNLSGYGDEKRKEELTCPVARLYL
jgi:hypothetical protein